MRGPLLLGTALLVLGEARAEGPYVPPPAESVPGYSAKVMPCHIDEDSAQGVSCDGVLEGKSLRELSILRNTIYARYGWDGYRKPWLRDYFHAQPWFKPNPQFSYKLLSDADRKNAHFIGTREQAFTDRELRHMRDDLLARYGKVWKEPTKKECEDPEADGMMEEPACRYPTKPWYKPNPKFSMSQVSAQDRIELGLLARAMGNFALDDEQRGKSEEATSLDRLLKLEEVRALSLRDLRLLRNTIYARRGRTFKSEALRKHFRGMSWYKPNADYSDKLLSRNDVRNIGLIRTAENELGGPLSDEDWLTEPAVDGA
jgi:hypothetical protein